MQSLRPPVWLVPLLFACSGSEPESADLPPNLLLLTLDTLRTDHVGGYGYPRDTTPNLDALMNEALVFERCFAPIAHTTPSHLSLLTGVYPQEHGVLSNANLKPANVQEANSFVATQSLISFAQHAAQRGYATGGFVSAAPLKAITGLSQGFGAWSEPQGARRTATDTLLKACAWLDGQTGDAPWFMWVHLFDAHGPYVRGQQPPPPYDDLFQEDEALRARLERMGFSAELRGRQVGKTTAVELVNLYDGSVRWLDDQLAPLFERLGSRGDWARTAVVVVGDHGQGLGQHDYLAHGVVWEEQLAVPLIMRLPGHAPARIPQLLSIVDVLPTISALLPGLAAEEFTGQFYGTNALATGPRPPVFGMSPPKRGLTMLRGTRWKIVRGDAGDELYDLDADPFERLDVAADHPDELARQAAALDEFMADQRLRGERQAKLRQGLQVDGTNAAHLREMEELGYMGEGED